jgi:hypothetical protein
VSNIKEFKKIDFDIDFGILIVSILNLYNIDKCNILLSPTQDLPPLLSMDEAKKSRALNASNNLVLKQRLESPCINVRTM